MTKKTKRKKLKHPTKRQIEKLGKEVCERMAGGVCWEGVCWACLRDAELELYREMDFS